MFLENIKLSQYSNYKIGGFGRYFYSAKNLAELMLAVEKAKEGRLPIFVLGGGTNLLFSDEGFRGLVLKTNLRQLSRHGNVVRVGAGVLMEELNDYLINQSLAGLEWSGGLPGTVGGAIRGNAGAFGGEIKDVVIQVVGLDISEKASKIIKRDNEECQFGYRESIFKSAGRQRPEIIVEAQLLLRPGNKNLIRQAVEDKIKWRKERQPLDYPNVGSIFKNVAWHALSLELRERGEFEKHIKTDPFPVIPTACLIDKAGLKGVSCGGAMISPKHPNFIVNVGGAEAKDVKQLIGLVKGVVKEKFGVLLEEEIMFV